MNLSNSKLNQFRNCPRSYFYKYICNLEPIEEGETEHDRSFGKAIHSGIESLYNGNSMEDSINRFKEDYPSQLDVEDLSKTQENGQTLIKAYWDQFSQKLKDWKILAVEVLDEYEVFEGVTFRVKLDLVAENLKYGGIYGFDWKTTGKPLNFDYWIQFNPNAQISTYFDYINSKFGQCAGFYIDALSFGYRQRKWKTEPAGFHYKIERQLFTQTKDQLDDWRKSEERWSDFLCLSTVQAGLNKTDSSPYPMNTSSCRYCSYRPICAAGWNWETDKELVLCQYKQRSISEA